MSEPNSDHLEGALAFLKAYRTLCVDSTVNMPPDVVRWLDKILFDTPPSVISMFVGLGLVLPMADHMRAREPVGPDSRE